MDEPSVDEPSVTIAALRLWIHRREFPDSTDHWDGNWLVVTACAQQAGATVRVAGPILTTMDLSSWRDQSRRVLDGAADAADLESLEPGLKVTLRRSDGLGHLDLCIDITPDHLQQEHVFRTEVDQSYLPGLIRELDRTLDRFPVR